MYVRVIKLKLTEDVLRDIRVNQLVRQLPLEVLLLFSEIQRNGAGLVLFRGVGPR
jgi:hypothetical protein